MTAMNKLIKKLSDFKKELWESYDGDTWVVRGVSIAISEANALLEEEKKLSIEFVEWVFDKYYFNQNTKLWFDYYTPKTYTTEQLYEIYKKQQP